MVFSHEREVIHEQYEEDRLLTHNKRKVTFLDHHYTMSSNVKATSNENWNTHVPCRNIKLKSNSDINYHPHQQHLHHQQHQQHLGPEGCNFANVDGVSHHLLGFLTLPQKLKLRVLCKRWKSMVESKDEVELGLSADIVPVHHLSSALTSIVSCFPKASSIDFAGQCFSSTKEVKNIIGKYRNSLKSIKIECYNEKPLELGNILFYSCCVGRTELAESLIKQGAPVDTKNSEGYSLLFHLAFIGKVKMVKLLLDHGVNINTSDCWSFTMLHQAALSNNIRVMKLLLQNKCCVDWKVALGTPLTIASSKGHEEAVRLLIEHKSNLEYGEHDGCAPLMAAASEGHIHIVRILLDAGASHLTVDDGGRVALNYAIAAGKEDIVTTLVTGYEYPKEILDRCLDSAIKHGYKNIAKILIQNFNELHYLLEDLIFPPPNYIDSRKWFF